MDTSLDHFFIILLLIQAMLYSFAPVIWGGWAHNCSEAALYEAQTEPIRQNILYAMVITFSTWVITLAIRLWREKNK